MFEWLANISLSVESFLQNVISTLSSRGYEVAVRFGALTAVIFIIAIFIWSFYKSISKRDLISMDLNRFNNSSHPGMYSFYYSVLYLIEYVLFSSVLIFIWVALLATSFFFISEGSIGAKDIVLITVAIILSARIFAYFNEEISANIANLIPYTSLALFLVNINSFDAAGTVAKIAEISQVWDIVIVYSFVIFFFELIARVILLIVSFYKGEVQN